MRLYSSRRPVLQIELRLFERYMTAVYPVEMGRVASSAVLPLAYEKDQNGSAVLIVFVCVLCISDRRHTAEASMIGAETVNNHCDGGVDRSRAEGHNSNGQHSMIRRTPFDLSFVCLSSYNESNTDISIRYEQTSDERQCTNWDEPIRLDVSVVVVHAEGLLGAVEHTSTKHTGRDDGNQIRS
jgi:hypothetical protein